MADKISYFLSKHGDCERPAVMWGWAGPLCEDNIVRQVQEFAEAGIKEIYIHPSWLSEYDDYLSDFFLDMIELACNTAESLGMKYSLYDEYDWCSGCCAGKLFKKFPELRMTSLKWFRADAQAGEPVDIWYRGELLCVQVQYTDKTGARVDITDQVKIDVFASDGTNGGGRVTWKNENTCTTQVFVFTRVILEAFPPNSKWSSFTDFTHGVTDTMNPRSIKEFIKMNNEVYTKRLGDKVGKTITRIFTDETGLGSLFYEKNERPYSIVVEDEFYKDHGYNIRDHFIALTGVRESDEDLKVCYDYYKTTTRLFTEGWLGEYQKWCHENGLQLTGHMSAESLLNFHTTQMGDFYEALSKFDVPGIDNILSKKDMEHPLFGTCDNKMIASLAKFTKKDKIMCETFTGSGWDLNLDDMKRIMNKLMLTGVTYIIYMTAAYTLNEGRIYPPIGYPPSHGNCNHLFRYYGDITDYAAVRSSLLSQTKPHSRALMLVPQVDSWTHMWGWQWEERQDNIWHYAGAALIRKSVDFDMFFEPIANEATVKDGKIYLRGYEYDCFVLPTTSVSNQATMDMLDEFAKQGGRIVFIDKIPYLAADSAKRYDLAASCGLSAEAVKTLESPSFTVCKENNTVLIKLGRDELSDLPEFYDELSKAVLEGCEKEKVVGIDLPAGVAIAHRSAEGLYCTLVFNDSPETQTVSLSVDSDDEMVLLEGVNFKKVEAKDGIVTLEIPAHEMPILMLTKPGVSVEGLTFLEEKKDPAGTKTEIVMDKGWTLDINDNMLPLKFRYLCAYEPCGKLDPELQKKAESANEPWALQEFPAGKDIKWGDGYAAYTRFDIVDMPEHLELFTEIYDDGELWLNGKRIEGEFRKVYERGPRDRMVDIKDYAKPGTNTLVMIHRVPSYAAPHMMPNAVVRGAFGVENDAIIEKQYHVDVNKYYTEQSWRYYSGALDYKNTFTLDKMPKQVKIKVETKEVAEIIVNGVSAGTYCWQPYEADVTDLCKVGENTIDIIFTTTHEPTMVLQDVRLVEQGVAEIFEEVTPQAVGTNTPPVMTIIS